MIKITVSNICTANNCPSAVILAAKKALTIENPAYHRVARMTGNPWAAQRDFKYYKLDKQNAGIISFPRGFYERFKAYLDKHNEPYEVAFDLITDKTKDLAKVEQVKLRDYQEKICADTISKTEGIVAASVGSGKTVIACWLIKHLGLKTTVLVPNTVIQNQFILEFKKWFDYDVGIVNGHIKNIKDITVSTFQSLSADKDLATRLANQTSMLISDECHSSISNERAKILKLFKPARLYGLSGSPRRSKDDGRTEAIFYYFGGIIASHMMPQVKPVVEVIRTGSNIPALANYHEMIDMMVADASRNKLMVGLALGEALSNHKVLILLKRVEHCKIIKSMLPDWGDLIYFADGEDKSRNDVLMDMRSGDRDFSILIGTFSLLSTGTDIPALDCLVLGGDIKSDVLVAQSSGRILRLFSGKDTAKIYDLFDNLNPMLKNQGYERQRFYKSQDWEIKI